MYIPSKNFLFTIVSVMLAVSITGCGSKTAVKTSSEEDEDALNVTVYEASYSDINSAADYTGEIMGIENASVSAKVSGEVQSITVEEGEYVNAGTTLLTIDSVSYQLAYNQALAAYNSAVSGKKSAEANYNSVTGGSTQQSLNQLETALNSAKLSYDNALDIYNKQSALYNMGAISEVDFNTYKTNLENATLNYESAKKNYELNKNVILNETQHSAQASVESAGAGVQQAKAALDIAAYNLKNCTVTAPVSGYVSAKNVTKGQVVSPGMGIFTITDVSSVEVQINVTESVITSITNGTKAVVDVAGAKRNDIQAEVTSFNPVKNTATGLYTVKISVPNDEGDLKAGMLANINLITEERNQTITIPSSALMQSEEGFYVYVTDGKTAEKREVEVGIENDEYTEIISGINNGDKVVVDGKEYISDSNNKVKIVAE